MTPTTGFLAAFACITAIGVCAARADENTPAPAAPETVNLYLAKQGLSPEQLLEFIDRMKAKPVSLRNRPGFSLAILDAADRILAADATPAQKTSAILEKLAELQYQASHGDKTADEQIQDLLPALRDDKRDKVAAEIRFLDLEQRVLAADAVLAADLPPLLDEIRGYFNGRTPQARDLRLASGTVRIINRVPGDELAQRSYREFGAIFARSEDRDLSRYGRKIEKSVKPSEESKAPREP
jgi:hypothetical protein